MVCGDKMPCGYSFILPGETGHIVSMRLTEQQSHGITESLLCDRDLVIKLKCLGLIAALYHQQILHSTVETCHKLHALIA